LHSLGRGVPLRKWKKKRVKEGRRVARKKRSEKGPCPLGAPAFSMKKPSFRDGPKGRGDVRTTKKSSLWRPIRSPMAVVRRRLAQLRSRRPRKGEKKEGRGTVAPKKGIEAADPDKEEGARSSSAMCGGLLLPRWKKLCI